MQFLAPLIAAGLIAVGPFQITALPPAPDGGDTRLDIVREKGNAAQERSGYALFLSKYLDVEYRAEEADLARDFGPALGSLREILSAGLPDLPHSYAALLSSERGPLGTLEVRVGTSAPIALDQAGQGLYIDGFPDSPRGIDAKRIERDFGLALQAQTETLKAMASYVALIEPPKGHAHPAPEHQDTMTFQSAEKTYRIDRVGKAISLDGYDHPATAQDIETDFAEALASMRRILAEGLPDLSHSYAVLLAHDMGELGHVSIETANAVTLQLERANEAAFIDGYPGRPSTIESRQLQGDFGPALGALLQALKSMRSYIVLLEDPFGSASKVIYRTRDEDIVLEHPGQSLTLDGVDNVLDAQLTEKDFSSAKTSTRQILDEGLPKLPHSYVALVSHASGPVGEVEILEGKAQGAKLQDAWQAVIIDGYSDKVYRLEEDKYRADFGESMAALPPPPVTHYLYFELGTTRLTRDSQAAMPFIYEAIRNHPAADISISGHADTVGKDVFNDRISLQRSEVVAEMIRRNGVPTREISVAAFGRSVLAVETPDNTPELLNRRVEIVIR